MKTRTKIFVAHLLYRMVSSLGVSSKRIIRRKGVRYEVDLAEGIDMSVFITGSFQKHVYSSSRHTLPDDAIILDIGANIGSICLFLPMRFQDAVVHAVEPSEFALRKLKRNIELNPAIQNRIHTYQYFVSNRTCENREQSISASWRIDDLHHPDRHPVHYGIQKMVSVQTITLDDFVRTNSIEKLDFVKIDTDGHELQVLEGASGVLQAHRPVIVFEMMSCTLDSSPDEFRSCERILLNHGYVLFDALKDEPVSAETILRFVPKGGSTDILAIPSEKVSSRSPHS